MGDDAALVPDVAVLPCDGALPALAADAACSPLGTGLGTVLAETDAAAGTATDAGVAEGGAAQAGELFEVAVAAPPFGLQPLSAHGVAPGRARGTGKAAGVPGFAEEAVANGSADDDGPRCAPCAGIAGRKASAVARPG